MVYETTPSRAYWDPDASAEKFHGQELMVWQPPRPASMGMTHRHDFPGLGRKNAFPKHNKNPAKLDHKFEAESTYNMTFKRWPVQPVHQQPAPLVARTYPGQWATTSQSTYQYPHVKQRTASRRDRPPTVHHPFEGVSTMTASYPAWPHQAFVSGAPQAPEASRLPFRGATTAQEAFKWPVRDRSRPNLEKSLKGPSHVSVAPPRTRASRAPWPTPPRAFPPPPLARRGVLPWPTIPAKRRAGAARAQPAQRHDRLPKVAHLPLAAPLNLNALF